MKQLTLRPSTPRPELDALLKAAAGRKMTPAEIWDQRLSFVYGNISLSNPDVTKEMVRKSVEETYGPRPSKLKGESRGNQAQGA